MVRKSEGYILGRGEERRSRRTITSDDRFEDKDQSLSLSHLKKISHNPSRCSLRGSDLTSASVVRRSGGPAGELLLCSPLSLPDDDVECGGAGGSSLSIPLAAHRANMGRAGKMNLNSCEVTDTPHESRHRHRQQVYPNRLNQSCKMITLFRR